MTVLILPSMPSNWMAVFVLLLGVILFKKQTALANFIIGLSVGILLINAHFNALKYVLPANSSIKGTIVSLPEQGKTHNRFYFELSKVQHQNKSLDINTTLLLSWSGQHELKQGQQWQFDIKAKPITGLFNQGNFNYQRHLISQGVIARGVVKAAIPINLTPDKRGLLSKRLKKQINHLSQQRFINALALGDKRNFSDDDWQIMRETGTSHLFAISGLHLSLIAVLVGLVIKFLLKLFTIKSRLNNVITHRYQQNISQLILMLCVIGGCTFYSFLAGFSAPTLRALTMIVIFSLGVIIKQRITFPQMLLFTLLVFGLTNPLSFLAQGFWLSLSAVSVVYLMLTISSSENSDSFPVSKTINLKHKIVFLIKLQLGLALLLCFVQVSFFGGISLTAPIANLIAVPVISLIVLPLVFIASCLLILNMTYLSNLAFIMANEMLTLLFGFLRWISSSSVDWLDGQQVLIFLLIVIITFGGFVSYIFLKLKMKWLVILIMVWLLFLISGQNILKDEGTWIVDFLDVGHGNSTVIRRNEHAIIIDTGNKFGDNSTLAEQVVMPFLNYHHIKNVDYIIATHQDSDHASGLNFLIKQFPRAKLINNHDGSCNEKTIHWYGLHINMAQVTQYVKKSDRSENNLSCLLRLHNNYGSVLLTGDIERAAERQLIIQLDEQWQSTVMQVPHHGSNTSSSKSFVQLIKPSIAIVSTNAFNQWHFPRPLVLNRYRQIKADIINTAKSGQITIEFSANGPIISTYRQNRWPFWYNGDLSFGHYQR